jgi:HCOMODA/2-hydroxy-3-carboxy-muconic semialdehyde decarboxylase
MSERRERSDEAIRELAAANHILASEGVVDALGHVSCRHPENPERYLLSCSRSPELVRETDIMEFDLENNPVDQRGRAMYAERPIHGAVYRARPDVGAVCHSHAHPLIPFSVTGVPLRPVFVLGATVG